MTRSRESQLNQYALAAKWHAEHPERLAEIKAAYVSRNPEKVRAAKKLWKERNPAVVLVATRKRQAKKRAALCDCCQGLDGKANLVLVYGLARRLSLHVDHVQPLAKGGRHCLRNLQLLTPVDNLRKGARWAA